MQEYIKKILGSGNNATTLIISNDEMEDLIETVKFFKDSDLSLKGVSETIQKGGFLKISLGQLGASLLGNILAGKGAIGKSDSKETKSKSHGRGMDRAGEPTVRAGYGNKKGQGIVRAGHLTNFKIQKYYQNEPRFNGVYSRDNLPKIKNGAYVINLDEYSDIGTHWIALYALNNNVTYFDSFVVEHILKEITTFTGNKNIKTIIFRI